MQFPFKRKKSEIVRKAKEERIVYEAIYKFFGDDSIKDDMITIGRIYHDNDDFQTMVMVSPYAIIFMVTYNTAKDIAKVETYKRFTGEEYR